MEIDGLAAAVARANLGPDVLARAAAWLAAEGASSVTQLEPDDIDGALYGLAHTSARPSQPCLGSLAIVGLCTISTLSATASLWVWRVSLVWLDAFALRRMRAWRRMQSS